MNARGAIMFIMQAGSFAEKRESAKKGAQRSVTGWLSGLRGRAMSFTKKLFG